MYQFGLKLYSTNANYLAEAQRLYAEGFCQYIELGIVPGSYAEYYQRWQQLSVPFVIHAPVYHVHKPGINLARPELLSENLKHAKEVQAFADCLHAEQIIFHGGTDGVREETVAQLQKINDSRIVIENKPHYSLHENKICVGSSPEDIAFIKAHTNARFCLDVGHAYFAANALQKNRQEFVKSFLKLEPFMFHVCDGTQSRLLDQHKHFGEGDFDIAEIFQFLPAGAKITIETPKNSPDDLRDFQKDIQFLRGLCS